MAVSLKPKPICQLCGRSDDRVIEMFVGGYVNWAHKECAEIGERVIRLWREHQEFLNRKSSGKITSFTELENALDKLLWGEAPDSLANDVYRLIRELKASTGLRKLKEFNALKERKIELRNDKHKGEALKFPYCFDHLKEEYVELLKAEKTGDKKKIAEELADVSNMCEFTFLALNSKEHLQIKQNLLKIMAKPPRMNHSITDLALRYSGFFGELISGSEIWACLNELLAENKIQKSGSFYGMTAAHPCENHDEEAGCNIMAKQGWGVNSECPFFTLEDAKTCADFKPRGG